jgi:hypothetical protein
MIEKIEIGRITDAQIFESEKRGRILHATVSLFDGIGSIKYDDLYITHGNCEYKFKYIPSLYSGMARSSMDKNGALFSLRLDQPLAFDVVNCVLYAKTYG